MDDELRRLERELNTTPADFDLRRKVAQAHRTRGNYLRGNEIMLAPEHIELPPFIGWPTGRPKGRDFCTYFEPSISIRGYRGESMVYHLGLYFDMIHFANLHGVRKHQKLIEPIRLLDICEDFISHYMFRPSPKFDCDGIGFHWYRHNRTLHELDELFETSVRIGDYLETHVVYPTNK